MNIESPAHESTEAQGQLGDPVHRILRNTTLNLTAQALSALANLAVVFTLARSLGKEGFGCYFTIFALTMVVQLIMESGLCTVLTQRIAKNPNEWKRLAGEAAGLFLFVLAGSAAALMAIGIVWSLGAGDGSLILALSAAACACVAIQTERYCVGVLRAFETFGPENFARAIQGGLYAGLILAAAMASRMSVSIALAMLATSHVVASTFLFLILQRRHRCLEIHISWKQSRHWMAQAVPLGLGDVARGLTWQLDTLALSILQPAAVVGIYSIAYRPLGPLNWISQAVITAMFPSFSRMAGAAPDELQRAFAHSTRLLWVTAIPVAVTLFVCAEPVIVLLAGPEYLEAVVPMRILIWVACLSFLSTQFRFLFTALGQQRLFARLVLLVLAIEAVIELSLIPWWGYFGACAGTLTGELVFTALGLYVCHRLKVGNIAWSAMLRAVAAGTIMGGGLWFFRGAPWLSLIAAMAFWGAVYVVLCIVLRALDVAELLRLFAAMKSFARPSDQESAKE